MFAVAGSSYLSFEIDSRRYPASNTDKKIESRNAVHLWAELMQMATSWNTKAVLVAGTNGGVVTFGGEKEASSSKLTRVMGLNSQAFKQSVSDLPAKDREEFLRHFMKGWVEGELAIEYDDEGRSYDLADGVVDHKGKTHKISMQGLEGVDYDEIPLEELEKKFKLWLSRTNDNPWSFIRGRTRRAMFLGNMPGIHDGFIGVDRKGKPHFKGWRALFGDPERFVYSVSPQDSNNGWEIQFKPLRSFGEHEEMKEWFRAIMGDMYDDGTVELFQAPGHQWIVFPKPKKGFSEAKFAELLKTIQALIIVDGVKGRTGIEVSSFKNPHLDEDIIAKEVLWGVIRVERNRFGAGSIGLELRAGTKDLRLVRFIEAVVAARVASGDWGQMDNASKWTLIADHLYAPEELVERFGVSKSVAEKVNKIIDSHLELGYRYVVPMWGWDDVGCPFISESKRIFLKNLTKNWLEQVAELPINSNLEENFRELMIGWAKASGVSESIRQYVAPAMDLSDTSKLHHFNIPKGRRVRASAVDVNKIDLGIEYSGKFPIKYDIQASEYLTSNENVAWVRTTVDLTDAEREQMIKQIAQDLSLELGGDGNIVKVEDASGHGHGLDVAYEITDPKNRTWKVEWDGINRSYTPEGMLIEGSARGGSIELVTPKFQPTMAEMNSVFRAFESNGIIPSLTTGGGHVNFDLAAFAGKPKEFARFLSLFHENRSLIALMFQHVHRARTSEPIEISDKLARELKNFNGTEEQLKKLLYNEQYFNTRLGRKTRYSQLDVSAYFQDVIPSEYLTQDFDISNPNTFWRRQFRVDPKIRKGEFRLFNAPRNAAESALQQKLVRALMSKALNETDNLNGSVQNILHEEYLENPDMAYEHLKKMCKQLGLKEADYKIFVAEGLSETDLYTRSAFYKTLEEKMKPHPRIKDWNKATARARSKGIRSEDHVWKGAAEEQAKAYRRIRRREASEALELREQALKKKIPIGKLYRNNDSCAGVMRALLEGAQ